MKLRSSAFFLLLTAVSLSASEPAAPSPLLGKAGKLLLQESFDGAETPKGWNVNTGVLRVQDGALRASEKAADKHIGAFRYRLPVQDCVVSLTFKLGEARVLNLGFDPAPGELKKKGHLFSVIITPKSWSLVEHNDKADPNSKTQVLARADAAFEPGVTYSLLLECKGNDIAAQVMGKEPLRASSPEFHVKKPGLVFRMGGKDGQEVTLDDVKVWALE